MSLVVECRNCGNLFTDGMFHTCLPKEVDLVNHPPHYTAYPGVEVIQLTEHMNFCKGSATKYIARSAFKGKEVEDLRKAIWFLEREIARLEKKSVK